MERLNSECLILGTRTLSIEIADIISEIPDIRLAGFVENMEPEKCREKLEGLPVYWVDDVAKLSKTHCAVCALATTHRKRFIEQVSAFKMPFATIVHPSARVSSKSSLGEGTIVSAGVVIGAYTNLGRHVIVNRGALIGHHTKIGDYVTIQPGANIAGLCTIGDAAYIGMGAIVLDRISVGSHSIVGAGSVVTKDVPDNVQVVGVPAKIVKENIDGK
jgi:sugar O-acyltransferase (sialic acid O-acetyltransferase NeuD family)